MNSDVPIPEITTLLIVLLAVLLIIIIIKGLVIVPQRHAMVIERLGRYHRTLNAGLNLIIPILDQPRPITIVRYRDNQKTINTEKKIDLREVVLDFPKQEVITKDNVGVRIDGVLYYQIMDAQAAIYGAENLVLAVQTLAQTSLRSEIGRMELDQIFESRQEINARLQNTMDDAGNKWGVKVNRVEIRDIDIPDDIREAMNKQMAAERARRAEVREAEGYKQAEILKAEGDKEAAVQRAEGEKRAIQQILEAAAGTEGLEARDAMRYLIAQEYMETLPKVAQEGERVFIPLEATSLMGSVGGIRELLGPTTGAAAASSSSSSGAGSGGSGG
ncbi:putative stomatin/prohibitin-family membrane protease subunit YbbK [Halorhodospira halochloris]|uniref:Stomatin/prohibitin-family membrane protease subunit YbbK n=1 Tax=Halorhodospira halochloris TaxID=1052 RepID=A0A0X8X8A2_HALHR|nr:stomatin-like protein [Halorhodospira halochloris]BAU57427.1 putative stomatin/prohibitin-family membrane protease subunit YbbK [Halorhodospira halochloris]